MHIKVDDIVRVISGADRGVEAKVLKIFRDDNKILLEGVAKVWKHVRRSQKNPQGGRLSKEMPIQISNVALVCTSCNKATRTGSRFVKDGSKERFCRKCDAGLGQIAPAREAHAQK